MADLSIIIDPGGSPSGRPGINLQVFPDGPEPLSWPELGPQANRLANQKLSGGGFNELLEFGWSATVSESTYYQLRHLSGWMLAAKSRLENWEVVIYNLAEQFVEVGPARTRRAVPSTPISSTVLATGWTEWRYWVVLQGNLLITPRRFGSLYTVDFQFIEGTKLVP
jgi:hypothetical protein